jgi:hypothetical protein
VALVDVVPVDVVEVVVMGNLPPVREVATQAEELDKEQIETLDIGKNIHMDAGRMLVLGTAEGGITDTADTADTVGKHM